EGGRQERKAKGIEIRIAEIFWSFCAKRSGVAEPIHLPRWPAYGFCDFAQNDMGCTSFWPKVRIHTSAKPVNAKSLWILRFAQHDGLFRHSGRRSESIHQAKPTTPKAYRFCDLAQSDVSPFMSSCANRATQPRRTTCVSPVIPGGDAIRARGHSSGALSRGTFERMTTAHTAAGLS
ncbi:MAG: hypothetical protein FWF28_09510, partial [Micrococcales bacterium]|nr:hypothetical protein [Micrococcales bacterium]